MTSPNRFGIPELTEDQVQRLLQAASMIADGDAELEESILEGSTENLHRFIADSDGSENAVEDAVGKTESTMPDLAFGDADDVMDEAMEIAESEEKEPDEFMGGNFESLDALEEEEIEEDKLTYEQFQEEWN